MLRRFHDVVFVCVVVDSVCSVVREEKKKGLLVTNEWLKVKK